MNSETTARVFHALASETRVKIMQILQGRTLCGNALAARLDLTPAAVSQHVRILKAAGLVAAEKRGFFVHYRHCEEARGKLIEGLGFLLGQENGGPGAGPSKGRPRKFTAGEGDKGSTPPARKAGKCSPRQITTCHGSPVRPSVKASSRRRG